jgi:hypothetical protein
MSKARLILIGIVLLVVGGVFAYIGIRNNGEDNRLDAGGQTVEGRVVDGRETVRRRGGRSYYLDVAYATTDGRVRHQKEFSVSKKVYEGAANNPAVSVTFLPSDPNVARIGGRRDNAIGMGIGAVAGLGGLGMLVFGILKQT